MVGDATLLENFNFYGSVFLSVVRYLVSLEMQPHAEELLVHLENEKKVQVRVKMKVQV